MDWLKNIMGNASDLSWAFNSKSNKNVPYYLARPQPSKNVIPFSNKSKKSTAPKSKGFGYAGGVPYYLARPQEQGGYSAGNPAQLRKDEAAWDDLRKRAAAQAAANNRSGGMMGGGGFAPQNISYTPPNIRVNPNDFRKSAAQAVAAMLNPQIKAIGDQKNQAWKDYRRIETGLSNRQAQADSDLKWLGETLQGTLKSLQGQTNEIFTGTQKGVDQGYAQLEADLTKKNAEVDAAVKGEAERLGLTNGQPVELEARRNQDQDFLMGLAQNNRASAATMLKSQQTNYQQSSNEVMAAETAEFANRRASTKKAYAEQLGDIAFEHQRTLTQLSNEKKAVEAQRGYMVQERIDQMAAAAQEAAERRAQQDFQNQMAVNNFNLDAGKFAADQQYRAAQLAQDSARITIQAQKAKTAALKQSQGAAAKPIKGMAGVDSFLNAALSDPDNRLNQNVLSIVQRGVAAFDRGDAFRATNDPDSGGSTLNKSSKANKSEILDWIRRDIERQNISAGDRLTAIATASQALDVYWDGY